LPLYRPEASARAGRVEGRTLMRHRQIGGIRPYCPNRGGATAAVAAVMVAQSLRPAKRLDLSRIRPRGVVSIRLRIMSNARTH
jgi:hypothetical protein